MFEAIIKKFLINFQTYYSTELNDDYFRFKIQWEMSWWIKINCYTRMSEDKYPIRDTLIIIATKCWIWDFFFQKIQMY